MKGYSFGELVKLAEAALPKTDNAVSATKLQTARTIGGVAFDGTRNISLPGVDTAGTQNTSGRAAVASTADKLTTARNINGVAFDGTKNIDISAGAVGTYTKAEIDAKDKLKLDKTGGTVTGDLALTQTGPTPLRLTRTSGSNLNIQFTTGGNSFFFGLGADGVFRVGDTNDLISAGNKVFHEGLPPTAAQVGLGNVNNTADSAKNVLSATKLATARTIAGVSFDGTSNISISAANVGAAPTSHTHTIANVTDLQNQLNYAQGLNVGGSSADPNTTADHVIITNHANSPDASRYWHVTTTFYSNKTSGANRAQIAIICNASGGACRMYTRSYYSSSAWTPWAKVYTDKDKPTASDVGALAVGAKAADSDLLDGLDSTAFVRYGSGSYSQLLGKNGSTSDWLRTTSNGLLPNADNSGSLGTSGWKFSQIHGTTLYENGTQLSSKYLGLNANAVSATKLATARTINGIAFDGTKNIELTPDNVGALKVVKRTFKIPPQSTEKYYKLLRLGDQGPFTLSSTSNHHCKFKAEISAGYEGRGGQINITSCNVNTKNRDAVNVKGLLICNDGWVFAKVATGISESNHVWEIHGIGGIGMENAAVLQDRPGNISEEVDTYLTYARFQGQLWEGGSRVFSPNNPPTADQVGTYTKAEIDSKDNGKLNLTGGTISGQTRFALPYRAIICGTTALDSYGWPNDKNSDANNYINRSRYTIEAGNNGLHFIGDGASNARRFGIQAGHSADLYANAYGTLNLNPYGGTVAVNGHAVYHRGNPPSATDVGALPSNGTAVAATKLATPRAINGVNFDGSANITITAAANGGTSAACSGNAATATRLQTARTIGGVSFDGTANINPTTLSVTTSASTDYYPILWESGGKVYKCNSRGRIRGSDGTLDVGAIAASGMISTSAHFSGNGSGLTNIPRSAVNSTYVTLYDNPAGLNTGNFVLSQPYTDFKEILFITSDDAGIYRYALSRTREEIDILQTYNAYWAIMAEANNYWNGTFNMSDKKTFVTYKETGRVYRVVGIR